MQGYKRFNYYFARCVPCMCYAYVMHAPCMCHACAMHVPCTCHACAMHAPCMCHACAMHVPCICHGRAMHVPCMACAVHAPCMCHACATHVPCMAHAWQPLRRRVKQLGIQLNAFFKWGSIRNYSSSVLGAHDRLRARPRCALRGDHPRLGHVDRRVPRRREGEFMARRRRVFDGLPGARACEVLK